MREWCIIWACLLQWVTISAQFFTITLTKTRGNNIRIYLNLHLHIIIFTQTILVKFRRSRYVDIKSKMFSLPFMFYTGHFKWRVVYNKYLHLFQNYIIRLRGLCKLYHYFSAKIATCSCIPKTGVLDRTRKNRSPLANRLNLRGTLEEWCVFLTKQSMGMIFPFLVSVILSSSPLVSINHFRW